jgi:hypothetical protein
MGILCRLRVLGWRWLIPPSNESYRTFLIRVSPHRNYSIKQEEAEKEEKERKGEGEREAYWE